jgi:PAS domain S-box-containing protein
MTPLELIKALAHDASVGVLVTDTQIAAPGPGILYANAAFCDLVGRAPAEVLGLSPRFMQGRETRRSTLDAFALALRAGERFHGYLTNYRADGGKYVAEIDCRPLHDTGGTVTHFVAFEREVARRRGRPLLGVGGRFEPLSASNASLTSALRALSVFERALPEP